MSRTPAKLNCLRCQHEWFRRSDRYPKVCPKCHSELWKTAKDETKTPITGKDGKYLCEIECLGCGVKFTPKHKEARCLKCLRIWSQAWREKRKAEGRPVKSGRTGKEKYLAYYAEYKQRPHVKINRAAKAREYRKRDGVVEKVKARIDLRHAVEAGVVEKLPCVVCGSNTVEGHHDDYSKPLDVVWLCRTHHRELHRRARGVSQ